MRIDFRGVSRPTKGLLPDGWYKAAVRAVEPKQASSGRDYWRLEFEIVAGDYSGTHVFDNLFFSEKALPRLKLALSALGLPHEGAVDVAPEDLVGRHALIEVTSKEGTDQKVRNVVTFDGYRAIPETPRAGTGPRSPELPPSAKAEEPEEHDPF